MKATSLQGLQGKKSTTQIAAAGSRLKICPGYRPGSYADDTLKVKHFYLKCFNAFVITIV